MKAEELRRLSNEELLRELESLKKKLFELRIKFAIKQLVNTNEIKMTRKDIARIKTILRERGIKV